MFGNTLSHRRVFAIGQTNVTKFLETTFGRAAPALIPLIKAAYPIGSVGLTNGYDVISAIGTDITFHCVSSDRIEHCTTSR
jgi:hypothetical protein